MDKFDYVVVGGGSAGSALAARLTEDPNVHVLLLEAGPSSGGVWTRIPLGLAKALTNPDILWPYDTEPEPGLGGRSVSWLSGRVLGGSSAVNGMLFVRGHPAKYDEWGDAGCPGWHYHDVLPYLQRLENCRFSAHGSRTKNGPISVERVQRDPLSDAFVESNMSYGLRYVDDYNDESPDGVSYLQLSTHRGVRADAARAYLGTARRRTNLTVRTQCPVRKVLFDGKRATGVEYERHGDVSLAHATREVILSAGAIRTPQILELSGIGAPDVLQNLGIQVICPSANVGENLQDHLMTRVSYECAEKLTINDLLRSQVRLGLKFLSYLLTRRGVFATPSLTATSYVRGAPTDPLPTLRIQLGLTSSEGRLVSGKYGGLDAFPGFHIGSYPLYPKSRGSCHIRSVEHRAAPAITAGYLRDEEDLQIALRGIEITRALSTLSPLNKLVVREVRPGPGIFESGELTDYIKATGHTCWHPVGTCRMGSDPDSVVDPSLLVRGVAGLRIADASVMPFLISSNTNVPAIMIGERAADLIRDSLKPGKA